ncbi:50S ribosomal protein L24 [Hydrogenivirga sp. 128-5-R1-1]|uniref:50S ribosomal protein L24 n=1 Tax=Hydrogenivirga sp. 128-5-R1-1 TaxID=392423 RepID=UPI00015EF766|nr:50S ribosomal protein L24 [Hydrogenivirga sp. 128-5-R1-1]EDP74964.1 aspartyl/glutamyl-tRNA amidotransferase subunit B [Hydrogenivirga sp. 128-5-R1-1]
MAWKIKKGDTVLVVRGKKDNKGKSGKVVRVIPEKNRVIVEGVNLVKKHLKEIPNVREGGIVEVEAPLHVSNVMLVCPNCKKPTRVGFRVVEEKGVLRKYRFCKKCNENIDLVREKQLRG